MRGKSCWPLVNNHVDEATLACFTELVPLLCSLTSDVPPKITCCLAFEANHNFNRLLWGLCYLQGPSGHGKPGKVMEFVFVFLRPGKVMEKEEFLSKVMEKSYRGLENQMM